MHFFVLFSVLLILTPRGFAADCPGVRGQVDAAWDAFYDAELDEAKTIVSDAVQSLDCQSEVVDTATLLELYRVDGLISLTKEDRKGSVYATIRAVTVDPDAGPPADMGPELAALHTDWAQRLSASQVSVRLVDGGEAWLDGREMIPGERVEVVAGEHLIQVRRDEAVVSYVEEITRIVVVTGEPVVLEEGAAPLSTGPDPVVVTPVTVPEVVPIAEPIVSEVNKKRRQSWELGLTGAVTTAAGGRCSGSPSWKNSVFWIQATMQPNTEAALVIPIVISLRERIKFARTQIECAGCMAPPMACWRSESPLR